MEKWKQQTNSTALLWESIRLQLVKVFMCVQKLELEGLPYNHVELAFISMLVFKLVIGQLKQNVLIVWQPQNSTLKPCKSQSLMITKKEDSLSDPATTMALKGTINK